MNTNAQPTGLRTAAQDNDGSVWGDIATGLFGAGANVASTWLTADIAAETAANEAAARQRRLDSVLRFLWPALIVAAIVVVVVIVKRRK